MTLSFAAGISKDVCFSFDTPEIDDRLSSKNRSYCLLDYILTNAKINITMQISDAIASSSSFESKTSVTSINEIIGCNLAGRYKSIRK